ncbi:alkaline phosphatase [Chitinophaga sp. LS1]|uniref:alkaline phosphatase n=1 Tax=Chitinophaga sp. LS1 TaxID=3051176 RepID=UPI002AAB9F45|nr:alkaline phosphatase [Chitinophaga sp. LS1]WPV67743.1 alkaline phosphatase [Chitinophaga sp. LS1]
MKKLLLSSLLFATFQAQSQAQTQTQAQSQVQAQAQTKVQTQPQSLVQTKTQTQSQTHPYPPTYTPINAHSHNDYEQPIPFLSAYTRHFGSIEADVYTQNNSLWVAHETKELTPDRTLESLYLIPLKNNIKKNNGTAYPNSPDTLQLLIDFKTDSIATMAALIKILSKYPTITNNPTIQIVISGNQPDPKLWHTYPSYILFDGKREGSYPADAAKRIPMYSTDLKNFTQWNGKGIIIKPEHDRIQQWIDSIHTLGKKVRFWDTPDNPNTWKTFMNLGVNYINTDKVEAIADFLSNRANIEYNATMAPHEVYKAKYINNDSLITINKVILLIGDGMGLTQIYSGFTGNRGQLNLLEMLNIGFSKTYSSDSYITDSAAGGTAMASGKKTNNRYVGVDATGVAIPAIPDIIAPKGYVSGIISAGDITDATPAAFYGHAQDRSYEDAIAKDFLNSPVSVLIGGAPRHFNARGDKLDMPALLKEKGYTFTTKLEDLDTIQSSKYINLTTQAELSMQNGRGEFLSKALTKTIHTLNTNKKGFFIMAEGAQIDYGGHANKLPYVITEMMDFDKAIGEAMKFADEDGHTLVIVTADHETGGLSLLDGNISKGQADGHFSTNDHTAVMVPVFAYGPNSLLFRGVYENTEIFKKIIDLLK